MHETHLIRPVIQSVSDHAAKEGAGRVIKLRLKVGELSCCAEGSFRETFGVLAKDTILDGTELELTFFPGSGVQVISFDIDD